MSAPPRVVFDCNIFLQALLSIRGPAFACWQRAANDDISRITSPYILDEIRRLPEHPTLRTIRHLTADRVERFIMEVLATCVLIKDVPAVFTFERDPDDAHYVDLAVHADAKLIVSRDNDLLSLMDESRIDAREFMRRFPALRKVDPVALLRELDDARERS